MITGIPGEFQYGAQWMLVGVGGCWWVLVSVGGCWWVLAGIVVAGERGDIWGKWRCAGCGHGGGGSPSRGGARHLSLLLRSRIGKALLRANKTAFPAIATRHVI